MFLLNSRCQEYEHITDLISGCSYRAERLGIHLWVPCLAVCPSSSKRVPGSILIVQCDEERNLPLFFF